MGSITIKQLEKHDDDNQRVLFSILAMFGVPGSILDLGCGTNIMVKTARSLGSYGVGVDILPTADVTHDLNNTLDLEKVFDLVICLEVAEHLLPESGKVLAETIAKHMHTGSKLVFSAACPGQGGDGHLNEISPRRWRDLFHDVGVSYQRDLTMQLALHWTYTAGALANWLPANVQVFDK